MTRFLSGDKVYLRGLTKEDCQQDYLRMVNDVETLSFVEGIGYYLLSPDDLEEYIESNNNYSNLLLGIFENNSNKHVGNIHLSQIKPHHNNCMLGIVLSKDFTGKGYAFEAVNLVTKHAFETMNIHRIQINVIEMNGRAVNLYERAGAVKEGRLREAFYYQNKYHDMLIYSILKNEYSSRLQNK